MKHIASILNYFSRINWLIAVLLSICLLVILTTVALYYINIFVVTGFGKFLLESADVSVVRLKSWIYEVPSLIFNIVFLQIMSIFSSLIYRGLSHFIKAKNNKAQLNTQISSLAVLPKYIFFVYLARIFYEFSDQLFPSHEINKYENIELISSYIWPEFGNALGLVFALIIYIYVKSLKDHEITTLEVEKLKQEAELVI